MARDPLLLIFDVDGVLINNDMHDIGSAKYEETYDLVRRWTGRAPDEERFDAFYLKFNAQAIGRPVRESSEVLASMVRHEYGVDKEVRTLVAQRLRERVRTYERRVRFIGTAKRNSGTWLEALPQAILSRAWLNTSTERKIFARLAKNPHLVVHGLPLPATFRGRLMTGSDVRRTKPDPESYERILRKARPTGHHGFLGIAFEDSRSGVVAAANARVGKRRLFVVGVETTLSRTELLAEGADMTVKRLASANLRRIEQEMKRRNGRV